MSRMLLITPMLIGLLAGGLLAPASASAQDDDEGGFDQDEVDTFDRTPVDCVSLNRVRRTEVIDDRTILFHLRGGDILRNYLPDTCPNLKREERFGYSTGVRRLCSIDTITVLERNRIGGFTCRLGPFYPMLPEELVELREGPSRTEVTPVEVPDEEPDEE